MLQNITQLVDAIHQAVLGEFIHRKFNASARRYGQDLVSQVDLHRSVRARGEQLRMHVGRNHDRQQRILERVLLEDIGERGADHRAKSELRQRPRSMLARAAAAEIVARQQHLRALPARLVQDEIGIGVPLGVVPPVVEKLLVQPQLGSGFQEARGDDLVGVHVVDGERNHAAFEIRERLHSSVLTSVTTPAMALAAAVNGLARKVRPPLPCRPSKLRLLVETLYSPGCNWSPFMAMHMEQPGSRHSHPAARKISGSPSAMACRLTRCEPGTTSTRTFELTLRPRSTPAAARRSEMRPLVQLPMKTTSMAWPSSGLPPSRPMYFKALVTDSRSSGSEIRAGSGSGAPTGRPMPGLV